MKLGLIKYKMPIYDNSQIIFNYECDLLPLSPDDLANGWIQKNPKHTIDKTYHHFSIKFTELPPNLWNKLKYNSDNECYDVKDGVYEYSIVKSEFDNDILELYKELFLLIPNINKIKNIYELLKKNNYNGWLLLKAKKLII